MRYLLIVLSLLLGFATSALAQVSISINLQSYPELVRVPGYPVYYSPRLHSNYFFYDGLYWVYLDDAWYESYWYNGPWELVGPEFVPLFVLRIPVRYYRDPPVYFRGWAAEAPPRWDRHWGQQWAQHRRGWDQWNRRSAPAPAPLPVYQRQYAGSRYPRMEQQQALHTNNYRYQPRDAIVRQHYQEQMARKAPAPPQQGQQGEPRERGPRQQQGQQDMRRSEPLSPAAAPQVVRPSPAVPPPERHGRAESHGNVEQRSMEGPRVAPSQAPPQAQPQAVPPAPQAQRRARAEPAPDAQQVERRPPAVAPQTPAPRPEPAPRAEPRGHEARPAADKQNDRNKGSDEQKGEQGNRKQER